MNKPSSIPHLSGCYLFYQDARVIYVGKAKDLSSRLSSYFSSPNLLTPKTQALMRDATSLDWIITPTEIEALLMENDLIKAHQPRYNIRLKDDKSYPYVKIPSGTPFPVPVITRRRSGPGRYFGPFPDAKALRATLDELTSAFPLRSCTPHKFAHHQRIQRPCLLYDIKKCSGPCAGLIDEASYQELINDWTQFFSGDSSSLESVVKSQMDAAAAALNFELAANRRDALGALRRAASAQAVVHSTTLNADALVVEISGPRAAVEQLRVRRGRVVGRNARIIDNAQDETPESLVGYCLPYFYPDPAQIPPEVLLRAPFDATLLQEYLSSLRARPVRASFPVRGHRRDVIDMAQVDANSQLEKDALRRTSDFAVRSTALAELAAALSMNSSLYRIECYDMSHLQGTNYVGSMVVFEDGLAKKDQYRKFRVKTVPGNNDVAAMAEVLSRRLAYWDSDPSGKFPRADLIIVDGGLPQLHATEKVIASANLNHPVPLAALAKREELLYVPGSSTPVALSHSSEALYLIQRLRDEAHRFAITFHRATRAKSMTLSILDDVPGLGPKRKAALLAHYPTSKALLGATPDDLVRSAKLPRNVANAIVERLALPGSSDKN